MIFRGHSVSKVEACLLARETSKAEIWNMHPAKTGALLVVHSPCTQHRMDGKISLLAPA